MNELPRQKLQELIRRFGISLAEDPTRCRGMLKDVCGEYRKEIAGLVAALEEGVADELLRPNTLVDVVRSRLSKKLEEDRGLTSAVAIWSVDTWALALNLITESQLRSISDDYSISQASSQASSMPISTPTSAVVIPSTASLSGQTSSTILDPLNGMSDSYEVVTVNNRGRIINRAIKQNKCIIVDLGNGVNLKLMYIPGGSFKMGSSCAESSDSEKPQYLVNIQAFYLGKCLVTQAQYHAIMQVNPAKFKDGLNFPVESINWYNAQQFCQKLSLKTLQNYRLPSESEWEYACRAGTTTPFYFGDTLTTEVANYNGNHTFDQGSKGEYRQKTTDVGRFPPNLYGLHDMHGNVWEWCEDTWHENYIGAPSNGSPWIDGNDNRRLLRGGAWRSGPGYCRSANRGRDDADGRSGIIGFRVVLSASPAFS